MFRFNPWFAFLAGLCLYVAAVTIAIEVQNARGGYPFPSHEYRGGDPKNGIVKMRQSAFPQDDRERAHNSVRNLVGSFGILQYLAAPALILFSLFSMKTRSEFSWLSVCGLLIGCTACGFIYYRNYFSSLGW